MPLHKNVTDLSQRKLLPNFDPVQQLFTLLTERFHAQAIFFVHDSITDVSRSTQSTAEPESREATIGVVIKPRWLGGTLSGILEKGKPKAVTKLMKLVTQLHETGGDLVKSVALRGSQ